MKKIMLLGFVFIAMSLLTIHPTEAACASCSSTSQCEYICIVYQVPEFCGPCVNGCCTPASCTDQCTSNYYTCEDSSTPKWLICGNYDADSCLEYSGWNYGSCSYGYVCSGGSCVYQQPTTTTTTQSSQYVTWSFVVADGAGRVCLNYNGNNYCTYSSTSVTVLKGATVTLSATPSSGYWFDGWANGPSRSQIVSTASSVTFPAQASGTFYAFFGGSGTTTTTSAPTTTTTTSPYVSWAIQIADGQGEACINYNGYNYCTTGYRSLSVLRGSTVTISANPSAGYEFEGWANGPSRDNIVSTDSSVTFSASGSGTFYTFFKQATQYVNWNLQVIEGSGTMCLDYDGNSYCTSSSRTVTVVKGSTVTLSATPSEGYDFSHFGGLGGDITDQSVTFTADASGTIYSYFVEEAQPTVEWALTIAEGSGQICVSYGGNNYCTGSLRNVIIPVGTEVTLTATASDGYEFTKFSFGGGETDMNPITRPATTSNVISAHFKEVGELLNWNLVVAEGEGEICMLYNGNNYCTSSSLPVTVRAGSEVTLSASGADGYKFQKFGGLGGDTDINPATFFATGSGTINAYFVEENTYIIKWTIEVAQGEGDVCVSWAGTQYCTSNSINVLVPYGTQVTLSANPDDGYRFDYWGGDGPSMYGGDPIQTFAATGNGTILAYFYPPSVEWMLGIYGHGTVCAQWSSGSYCSTSTSDYKPATLTIPWNIPVTLSATPSDGYDFQWFIGQNDIPVDYTPVSFTTGDDGNIYAYFTPEGGSDTVTWTIEVGEGKGEICASYSGYDYCTSSSRTLTIGNGTTVTLSATADDNYRFIGFGGHGTEPFEDNPISIPATGTGTIFAMFDPMTVDITIKINQGKGETRLYSYSEGRYYSTSSEMTVTVDYGSRVELSSTPAYNEYVDYTFSHYGGTWDYPNPNAAFDATESGFISTYFNPSTIDWTISSKPLDAGIVCVAYGSNRYCTQTTRTVTIPWGTFVTLSAAPRTSYYTFDYWEHPTDPIYGTTTIQATVTGNGEIPAVFRAGMSCTRDEDCVDYDCTDEGYEGRRSYCDVDGICHCGACTNTKLDCEDGYCCGLEAGNPDGQCVPLGSTIHDNDYSQLCVTD